MIQFTGSVDKGWLLAYCKELPVYTTSNEKVMVLPSMPFGTTISLAASY